MKHLIVKIALFGAIAVVLVAGIVGGLAYAMLRHFNAAPPAAAFRKAADPIEAQRQDLAYFRQLMGMDRSFSPAARAEAERRLRQLEALGTPLDKPHLRVALMEILALADNGHTHLSSGPGAQTKELPVRVAAFSDGLYVMRASESASELLGGRVTAIDGKPISEVMDRLSELRGGTAGWRRLYAAFYIVDQDILYGTGISPDPDHATWSVVRPDGGERTITLDAQYPPDQREFVFVTHWVSDEFSTRYGPGWRIQHADRRLPVTLRDFDRAFRTVRIDNSCTTLVQLKSNDDVGSERIREFLSSTLTTLRASKPCSVIVDLRFDDGGNYQNTASFAKQLPELIAPGGRIFILTGPSTFSAGITTAAFIKQAGGDRVEILGEPIGDRLAFFAEGNRGCLPNYPLCVSYERGKHDYAHPCDDWDVCFWLNRLYPVRVRSLDPDETFAMSFAQWRAGQDPPFDRAVALSDSRNGH